MATAGGCRRSDQGQSSLQVVPPPPFGDRWRDPARASRAVTPTAWIRRRPGVRSTVGTSVLTWTTALCRNRPALAWMKRCSSRRDWAAFGRPAGCTGCAPQRRAGRSTGAPSVGWCLRTCASAQDWRDFGLRAPPALRATVDPSDGSRWLWPVRRPQGTSQAAAITVVLVARPVWCRLGSLDPGRAGGAQSQDRNASPTLPRQGNARSPAELSRTSVRTGPAIGSPRVYAPRCGSKPG